METAKRVIKAFIALQEAMIALDQALQEGDRRSLSALMAELQQKRW